jgi:hypothetical protein
MKIRIPTDVALAATKAKLEKLVNVSSSAKVESWLGKRPAPGAGVEGGAAGGGGGGKKMKTEPGGGEAPQTGRSSIIAPERPFESPGTNHMESMVRAAVAGDPEMNVRKLMVTLGVRLVLSPPPLLGVCLVLSPPPS